MRAKNARLNLHHLGPSRASSLPDFYGTTSSPCTTPATTG